MGDWFKEFSVGVALLIVGWVSNRNQVMRSAIRAWYIKRPAVSAGVIALVAGSSGFGLAHYFERNFRNLDPSNQDVAVNKVAPELPNENDSESKSDTAGDASEHTVLKPPGKLDTKLQPNKKHSNNPLSDFVDLGDGWLKCKDCKIVGKFLDMGMGDGTQFYERAPEPIFNK